MHLHRMLVHYLLKIDCYIAIEVPFSEVKENLNN